MQKEKKIKKLREIEEGTDCSWKDGALLQGGGIEASQPMIAGFSYSVNILPYSLMDQFDAAQRAGVSQLSVSG